MKKPGDFIVFIDMDNVLENFTQLWVRILNADCKMKLDI
jgi:hypothetical protein